MTYEEIFEYEEKPLTKKEYSELWKKIKTNPKYKTNKLLRREYEPIASIIIREYRLYFSDEKIDMMVEYDPKEEKYYVTFYRV